MAKAKTDSLIERLRNYDQCNDSDVDEAADMLEFMFGLMQSMSPKMNGQHHWRFVGGWPMTCAIGSTPEEAIRGAMAELKASEKTIGLIDKLMKDARSNG